ncbi:MAG: TraR/DksA C4-type zinc finger protein [Ectothiorhodospiraceae bacterium]|jgi:DnaK suppressor protein
MRTDIDIDALRERLLARRQALTEHADMRDQAADTVELDQTRTGRLTRMDAMQAQAMAQASRSRAQAELKRIAAALRRMDEGEYGYCLHCDEDIAAGRLEADPSTPLCIHCADAAEHR